MDDASVNYVELIALTRITQDSTVERFGSLINSSFFDASNILATMKQKGLVDFITAFPAQSTLKITDVGNKLLSEAKTKSAEPVDALDLAIMGQLANGKRGLVDLNGSVNVTQRDLAVHLFKLNAQQHISYELANANMNIYLTEKGFIAVKSQAQQAPPTPEIKPQQAQQAQSGAAAQQQYMQANALTQQQTPAKSLGEEMKVIDDLIKKSKARKRKRLMLIIILVAVVVLLLVYLKMR